MTGAGGVVALVLLEWSVGWIGAAAWTQSWSVVRRGHFRIIAWGVIVLSVLTLVAVRSTAASTTLSVATGCLVGGAMVYLVAQYSRTDLPGTVAGAAAAVIGVIGLVVSAWLLDGWPSLLAVLQLVAGALLLGAVTNGMLLGHWYLNQPGLKSWALARLTALGLAAAGASAATGLLAAGRLSDAATEGAVLGLPGFGESFGMVFFLLWLVLVGFTGALVWLARRCVRIRSIQSATGLYYVALLTAGVSEFVVRYLMVHAV
jgi:hypothetical protein